MKIGIVKAGQPPADLIERFGSYTDMIAKTIAEGLPIEEFDVRAGRLPEPGAELAAVILSGSASSVYEDREWIQDLMAWLRQCDPSLPLIGICFGHQVMAAAYGGKVGRSRNGAAVGVRQFQSRSSAFGSDGERLSLPVAHFDQVVQAPPAADLWLTSDYCPQSGYIYRDRAAASLQPHPEFPLAFAEILIDRFLGAKLIDREQAGREREALAPTDASKVNRWLSNFISSSTGSHRRD